MSKGSKTLSNVIIYILAILLVLGVIGVCVYYIGGADKIKSWVSGASGSTGSEGILTVEYAGQSFGTDNKLNLDLATNGKARFDVKGVSSYTVEVKANSDFEYTVNGQNYSFSGEKFTSLFMSDKDIAADYFEIDLSKDYSAKAVLKSIWNVDEDALSVPADVADGYIYKLVISSGSANIQIGFRQVSGILDVSIDSEKVVF